MPIGCYGFQKGRTRSDRPAFFLPSSLFSLLLLFGELWGEGRGGGMLDGGSKPAHAVIRFNYNFKVYFPFLFLGLQICDLHLNN